MTPLEIAANFVATVSILLAGRNNVHTWWTGIIGSLLFGLLFYDNQLYADVTLQLFFIGTSIAGWIFWTGGQIWKPTPVTRVQPSTLFICIILGALVSGCYGFILHRFTDAYAPFWDSAVLVLSVIAQLLLLNRKIENWPFWLAVNSVAVPLYFSRGLYLTSGLYALYWINAIVSYFRWRYEMERQALALP